MTTCLHEECVPAFRGQPLAPDVWRVVSEDADEDWRSHVPALRTLLRDRGFVLIRRALPQHVVHAAGDYAMRALESVGEVFRCNELIYATRSSSRAQREREPGEWWSTVTRSREIMELAHGEATMQLMQALMGERVCAESAVYLRSVGPGTGSLVHTDYPPVHGPDPSTLKVWIALTPVEADVSGLFLLPKRGTLAFLRERSAAAANRFREIATGLATDPCAWLREHRVVLATACLQPGDAFVFDALCPHGSFDNTSASGRVRLSCDVGWQPARVARSEHIGAPPCEAVAYRRFVGARLSLSREDPCSM